MEVICRISARKGLHSPRHKRRGSSWNTGRIDHLINNSTLDGRFTLHYADMSDYASVFQIISKIHPDEIYNLAAQSHVMTSFDLPEYTSDITGLGLLRVLESVRACGIANKCQSIKQERVNCMAKWQNHSN